MKREKIKRLCENGHTFYKSSDCPVCPVCERENGSIADPFASLSAPAKRALENAGITSVKQLSTKSEKELLKLHGFGPSSLPKIKLLLEEAGLGFKSGS